MSLVQEMPVVELGQEPVVLRQRALVLEMLVVELGQEPAVLVNNLVRYMEVHLGHKKAPNRGFVLRWNIQCEGQLPNLSGH